MLLATRSWLPVNTQPPVWITTSPLPEGDWGETYSAVLLATSDAPPVSYSLPSGSLPPGLALVGDTIGGTPHPAPSAPSWTSAAGSLGTAVQGGGFSTTLTATGAASFAVWAGGLPWGVTLDVDTGVLSGALAMVGGATDVPGSPPVWTTAIGNLGTVRETPNGTSFPVSFSLAATGAATYTTVDGVLPWGLTLDRDTGALTGRVWNVGGGTWEPDTAITWSAPVASDLGSFDRGASIGPVAQTINIAVPFWISEGRLPWGLTMVRSTGAISGTISPDNTPGAYSFTVSCAASTGFNFGQRTYSITIT